jgi:hypothetical protein
VATTYNLIERRWQYQLYPRLLVLPFGISAVQKQGAEMFTVITPTRVLRIKAKSEAQIRNACTEVGITVLGIDKDKDV